ncbi:hypothetical protein RN347_12155 [Halomonas sp. PAMB 3264]|uniref:hypothetical protein n=1 Tax=unclassified Halomonas TaxID=2609666 RepID=UPI002899D5DF|nr:MULTISPECIES: hypothetical protein [unclassified Halomonas]WNL38043.1 hypothetical protein RN346_12170 [Halomonas sp. PAMB 3232]WNL41369.1 hypothetical protein RN347_12155 [Halomonas sp. PAMB 3264]
MAKAPFPHTPDGRYFVAKNRLWRATNPALDDDEEQTHVNALMKARRAVKTAKDQNDDEALKKARSEVQKAKVALGERGPVWWDDGAPDENERAPENSSYAEWWREYQKRHGDPT